VILKLYKQFENVANNEYGDIIENAENNYSLHWEQKNVRNTIYRHDNAPHKKWSNIKTFPKHCRDEIKIEKL
jgi:hypothetical protein